MAQNEQVRVDIVADDQASKTLDHVAERVDDLEHADINIPVDADTSDAERALRDVRDDAERVGKVDIPVSADTSDAERGLSEVKADVQSLTDADRELVIKAQIGDGKAAIKDLQSELDDLQGRAKTASERLDNVARDTGGGGGKLRGQAIADLTGPLGDVSSQASDLAGVFDGLGDTLGGLGGRLGVSADAIEGAMGGISFAVAGAVALWGLYRQSQQKAREESEKLLRAHVDLQEALSKADYDTAAKKLTESYGDAYDAAKQLGISVEDVTRFITGQADTMGGSGKRALQDYNDQIAAANKLQGDAAGKANDLSNEWINQTGKINEAHDRYKDLNGVYQDNISTQDRVANALQNTEADQDAVTSSAERMEAAARRANDEFDRMSDAVDLTAEFHRFNTSVDDMQAKVASGTALAAQDIDGLKQDIINLAKDAKANPAEVKSTLDKIDQGDLAGVKADAERYYAQRPVVAQGTIDFTKVIFPNANQSGSLLRPTGATYSAGISGGSGPAPFSVVNVTQYLPRGFRGDALGEARRAAKRAGGLYQRFSR